MTHLSPNQKSLSLWQRLLLVFNIGGPQWGRPQGGGRDENDPQDESQEDWNEDGEDGSDERDPRDRDERPDRSNRPSGEDDTPPDLDEIWKDLSGRLGGFLGNGGSGGSGRRPPKRPQRSGGGRPPVSGKGAGVGVGVIAIFAVLAWAVSGLFTVQEGQQAVILTFGKYNRSVGAGLSWRFPYPIETHEMVAVDQLKTVSIGNANVNTITGLNNASMLTQDKNILDIRFEVQYRISDIKKFLFFNVNPDAAVTQAAESAVREVVGRSPMDVVIQRESCSAIPLTAAELQAIRNNEQKPTQAASDASNEGANGVSLATGSSIDSVIEQIADESVIIPREIVVDNTKATCDGTRQESLFAPILDSIQGQLDKLNTGISIINVNILDVQVPDKVKPAFDEARSATAERASLINEGWAYANATVASAKGVVARLEADANAHKTSVVSQAKGETQRFVEIYEQYRLAPDITRRRMYLEAMEEVYGNVSKIMMESGNNSLLYVPIDRLMNPQGGSNQGSAVTEGTFSQGVNSSDAGASAGAMNNAGTTSVSGTAATTSQQGVRDVSRSR